MAQAKTWNFLVDYGIQEQMATPAENFIPAPSFMKDVENLWASQIKEEEPEYIKAGLESQEEYNIAIGMKEDWFTHKEFTEVLEQYRGRQNFDSEVQEAEEGTWFFSSLWESMSKRWSGISEVVTRLNERPSPEWLVWAMKDSLLTLWSSFQVAWQGAGAVWDVVWQVFLEWLKILSPKQVEDATKDFVQNVASSDEVQSMAASYDTFRENNPELARNIEAAVNIWSLIPIGKGVTLTWKWVDVAETTVKKSLAKTAAKDLIKDKSYIDDLVVPQQLKKQAIEDISKGRIIEGGLIKWRTREITSFEKQISDEVAKIPWVSSKNTILENNNLVLKQIWDIDNKLLKDLDKNPVIIPKKEVKAALSRAKTELAENPLLVWDAEKTAARVLKKFEQLIDEQPWRVKWILEARRNLDKWIKKQKPNVFSWDKESALSIALTKIRTTANDLVDAKVKNVPVKEALKRQSNLFRAVENIAPKARLEAWSKVWRVMQDIKRLTWLKWEVVTALSAGWLLWGTLLVPSVVWAWVWLWLTWLGIKWLISPTARKWLLKWLEAVNKWLKATPVNPELQVLKNELEEILDDNK